MNALLIGATGATGKELVQLLLKDDSFQTVTIFVRRKPEMQHPKLIVHVIDFDKPQQWKELVKGDVLFSCLGTTLKAAGSKEAQWKIDYEYQFQFAKAAKENQVANYVLVSSAGADPASSIFYTKLKGKLEEAVKGLGFPKITILKPSLLARKNTDRKAEVISMKVIQFLNKLGLLRSMKPLPTETLAQAMINCAKSKETGLSVIKASEVWKRAQPN
jgi:uncharacterized protein YbjT (DUF2867 family)